MIRAESHTGITESYYECVTCGYTSRTGLAVEACPLCGEELTSISSV